MRLTSNEIDLPLSAFEITELHSKSSVFGLFLPSRSSEYPSIVDGLDGHLIVVPLEGPRAFKRFLLQTGGRLEGLLFPDIKFAVNLASHANPNLEGQRGDLTIIDGKVHLSTTDARNGWEDVEPFPLQSPPKLGSDVRARFQQWSLFIELGRVEIELWKTAPNLE